LESKKLCEEKDFLYQGVMDGSLVSVLHSVMMLVISGPFYRVIHEPAGSQIMNEKVHCFIAVDSVCFTA
jgi:hypothetical protein